MVLGTRATLLRPEVILFMVKYVLGTAERSLETVLCSSFSFPTAQSSPLNTPPPPPSSPLLCSEQVSEGPSTLLSFQGSEQLDASSP